MLRKKKADEYWTVEELLEEQLAFQKHDGTLVLIVHAETDKPYLAREMCEAYYQNKLKEQSENVIKSTKSEVKGQSSRIIIFVIFYEIYCMILCKLTMIF